MQLSPSRNLAQLVWGREQRPRCSERRGLEEKPAVRRGCVVAGPGASVTQGSGGAQV